jgi:hypothetical protein
MRSMNAKRKSLKGTTMSWKNNFKQPVWNLSDPAQARHWLKALRIRGKPIEFLEQADGGRISIDDASDEQVLRICHEMAMQLRDKGAQA